MSEPGSTSPDRPLKRKDGREIGFILGAFIALDVVTMLVIFVNVEWVLAYLPLFAYATYKGLKYIFHRPYN